MADRPSTAEVRRVVDDRFGEGAFDRVREERLAAAEAESERLTTELNEALTLLYNAPVVVVDVVAAKIRDEIALVEYAAVLKVHAPKVKAFLKKHQFTLTSTKHQGEAR